MTIVEATAGNTGVGLALAGINRGYKVVLFVPEGFAEEKVTLMRAFGATDHRTPEKVGIRASIREAKALAQNNPSCFLAMQLKIRPTRTSTMTLPRRSSGSRCTQTSTPLSPA